jgi:hypothetical protein
MVDMTTTWTKQKVDGHTYYVENTGRYRIQRHEVDDTWDTGALVPVDVQWVREELVGPDDWYPVEIHNRLSDAKAIAEARLRV